MHLPKPEKHCLLQYFLLHIMPPRHDSKQSLTYITHLTSFLFPQYAVE